MIKVKQTKEYFQETCKCGKKIIAPTKNMVKSRMRIHKLSKNCKLIMAKENETKEEPEDKTSDEPAESPAD